MTRACGTTGVADGCTTIAGIETCYCSGDLCNSAGGTSTSTYATKAICANVAGVISASTSFTFVALIFTKFF